MNKQTNRSILSLAQALPGHGPRFQEEADGQVIDALVDKPTPKPVQMEKPAVPAGVPMELVADLFSDDVALSAAAAKKLAKVVGAEERLEKLMSGQPTPKKAPEAVVVEDEDVDDDDVDPTEDIRRQQNDLAIDYYIGYLNSGVEKIMSSPDVKNLLDFQERTGNKDLDAYKAKLREKIESRVADRYKVAHYSQEKIRTTTLDKILGGAQDDVLGLIRSTIGDPTGLGRHAPAQTTVPGSNISDEQVKLPDLKRAQTNPLEALDEAQAADEAFFLKKLAMLQGGKDGTNA